MNEQERRNEYFKLTGRIATSDQSGYFAFCKGIEYEREACAKVAEIALRHYTGAVTGVAEAIRGRSNAEVTGRPNEKL